MKYEIKPSLRKILNKLAKKDRVVYEQILKKIQEIISCKDLAHYKNLRKPMQEFKRVHIRSSFVLIFKCVDDKITFCDLDHHDNIYS